jgi:hypothetical protein
MPYQVVKFGESLARHCPNEAFHLSLVVVIVHAGADERVQSARGQIERGRARRAGHVDVDAHSGEPLARLARRFALFEKGDDPTLLHADIVHADAGSLRELPPLVIQAAAKRIAVIQRAPLVVAGPIPT